MHEMSIAQSLLDIVLQESQQHQVTRVLALYLKIGELSAVETESLRFCFDLIARGTPVEGARLDIEEVPITCRCRVCGCRFRAQELDFNCPACKANEVDMVSGRELSLESFEAE
jgi:hydrogenase nickel incorporation protein HypA/HybF